MPASAEGLNCCAALRKMGAAVTITVHRSAGPSNNPDLKTSQATEWAYLGGYVGRSIRPELLWAKWFCHFVVPSMLVSSQIESADTRLSTTHDLHSMK